MTTLHNKGYSIFGSILGSPYLGKLPYIGIMEHTDDSFIGAIYRGSEG